MENKNQPAFPVPDGTVEQNGLSKREYYSGLAMQGLLMSFQDFPNDKTLVSRSIEIADELLKQLTNG